ncbi:ABC transporter substrate-binding protein [Ottowia testudinis]|uniref:ABC transporter substrate-binding protein n=1 Tax=Ottowia testudinis TaxID=2816950 RepID=A0A975H4T0_9BURK|nr:ABC transporter substrate-binding protein [Ottowia testudinis]QTD46695.1 ABC transporter substrate-binding protein [Ottowia testudinis]
MTLIARYSVAVVLASCASAVWAQDIVIGLNQPLSGPNAAAGQERLTVTQALFDRVNAAGGIGGRKLKLQAMDDKFQNEQAAANYRDLAGGPAVALLSCSGTGACSAIAPEVNKLKLPVIAPIAGGGAMRSGGNPYIFNLRPTTLDEINAMVKQMLLVGQKNIALVYQNDGFGKSGQAAAEQVFKQNNVKPAGEFPVEPGGADADQVAAALAKLPGLHGVVMVASPNATVKTIVATRKAGSAAQFYNLAAQANAQVVKDLGTNTRGVVFAALVPHPWSTIVPIAKEYRDTVGTKANYSYAGMEFFIGAKLLVDAIKRAGPTVTRDTLVKALESMDEQHFGPMRVRYTSSDHEGSKYVNLTMIGQDGKFVQ